MSVPAREFHAMTEDEFEAHIAGLRDRFIAQLPSYRQRLVEARNLFAVSADHEVVRTLKRVAHEIAGTGGTFGYPELGEMAAELESAANAVLARDEEPAVAIAPLRRLIREIEFLL